MNVVRRVRLTAEAAEARWDGLATVAAVLGISTIAVTALVTGAIGSYGVLVAVVAVSGLGGYSLAHKTLSPPHGGDQNGT